MTKAKVAVNNSKNHLKHAKDGSIHKKKQQKFKNTPNGKVPLINGTPSKIGAKQMSPKNGNGVAKSPKSPHSPKAQNGAAGSKKGAKNSPKSKKPAEEEDDDDSEEDFNEGINISEIVSGQEDEDDDDSSEDDAVPDVLTTTLPDVTDESDADFDVTTAENKGVKMFRGINAPNKEAEESEEDDDEDEDDEDDEEDEDEDKPALGLSALLGDSIKDESGDEDFVGMETSEDDEDEEDDDDDEEDESDEETMDQSLNSSNVTSTDDDDDEEEDDDDDDESSADVSDLLGTSLADESDDNDFEADDDDADQDEDISSEEDDGASPKSKKKKDSEYSSLSPEEKAQLKAEHDRRTVFVGNIPKDTKVQTLTREFKKFGPIETVRLRGIIPGDPKMSLKVAAIKKNFHEKSKNICAFIRYENEESVKKALGMNGKKFEGNYLRVDRSQKPKASDKKKSVFLGNLPFTVEDNILWEAFKDCGRIESVRIIRHRGTGLGRGFGYINFETSEGAVLALSLDGTEISDRKIRVKSISGREAAAKKKQQQQEEEKTPEKGGKRKHKSESESNNSPKKVKTDDSGSVERATHNSVNAERRTKKGKKRSQGDKQRSKSNSSSPKSDASSPTKFQGQTGASKNKKSKQDKTSKKKKQMAAKLLAKPKKPSAN